MKKIILIILSFAICTLSYSQRKDKIKGDKDVITTANDLPGGFHILEVSDDINVTIALGRTNNYVLTTDKNLVSEIQFAVSNETLKIYTSSKIQNSKKLDIYLEMNKLDKIILKDNVKVESKGRLLLDNLTIDGRESANFELDIEADMVKVLLNKNSGGKLTLKCKDVDIVMNDRTDLKADIKSDQIKVSLTNSATVTLDGNINEADFSLEGNSNLKAKKMKTSSSKLSATNNSDIHVFASKKLEVYAEGRSKIFVYGNPSIELKGLTNKSKIIKK